MPISDKPRERFLSVGADNLSNEELISIILSTGTKDKSVKDLAKLVLKELNSINELKEMTVNRLSTIKGIGKVKAITLLASLELGKRVYLSNSEVEKVKIRNSRDVYNYFCYKVRDIKQERFYVLYLDSKKVLIKEELLFVGTLDGTTVHPREIFKEAIRNSASCIICVHNHPSGDATPSDKDVLVTSKLKESGEILGIHVIDHVIIGNNNYYSFYE